MVGYVIHMKKKKKNKKPEWLELFLKSKFFESCLDHQYLRKNEMNVFCIDCNRCVCQHCVSFTHYNHEMLQIRRYVYQDVVRFQDMQKHLDCSKVQQYTINGAKAIFLNPRPQAKPSRTNSGSSCEICERSLQEPNRYCSIACKIAVSTERVMDESHPFSLPIPEFNDIAVKKNKNPETNMKEEASSSNSAADSSEEKENYHPCLSSALKPKKQTNMNKRKGVPRRAPIR